ncbi:MAG TPA: DoxX family protein [Steroidobacteraceae bacterium]
MNILRRLRAADALLAHLFDYLRSPFALLVRWYVSWQFLKAGFLKLTSWDSTIYLFENEYHTPVLSPHVAAVAGTVGELFFPTLLVIGFVSRFGAIGLFAVNAMAVISYSQVLLAEGYEAALAQHVLWGTLIVFLAVYGPGKLSIDQLLQRRQTQLPLILPAAARSR